MKKLLATALALTLTFGTFALPSAEGGMTLSDFAITVGAENNEDTSGNYNGLNYCELDDGTIEIYRYNGDAIDVVIPSEIDNKKVTSIGYLCFENSYIRSITIPEGVTNIGFDAFYNCTALENIIIPASVTNIGSRAFDDTPWLKNQQNKNPLVIVNNILVTAQTATGDVIIPDGVKIILESAFSDCTNVTSISIPDSVKEIKDQAFYGCTSLTSIILPDSVTFLGGYAFNKCSNLESIVLSDSLERIDPGAFEGCKKLKSLTIPDGVSELDESVFNGCTELSELNIGSGLKRIGTNLCMNRTAIKSLTLSEGLQRVDSYAFSRQPNLKYVVIPKSVKSIGERAFGFELYYIDGNKYNYGYKYVEDFKLGVYAGSAGEDYAKEYGIPYDILEHTHSYTSKVTKPATCTENGVKTYTCECGDSYTETIPATGHISSDWIIDKNAAINVKGSKHKECTVCKTVLETADIPALPMINIQSANVSVSTNSYVFDNTAKKPSVTVKIGGKALKNGSDYTVSYLNNTKVGTATVRITGKGDYTGTITRNFTINPAKQQIQKLETRYKGFFVDWAQKGSATGYEVQYATNSNFTGAKRATITNNKTDKTTVSKLSANKTYYVRVRSYTNRNGKVYYGAWSDVKSIKTANNDITKATVSGISTKAFTGKAITQNVTVKVGNTVLKNGTDYTVSYSNNKKVGKATVKITGKGKYGGVITKTFKINPAKQEIQKLTAKSKSFFVDWAQKGSATGYEIQYATNSKFTGAKKVTITNNKTDKTTVSKLSANKKYYVRVRSYTTVGGTKYYGAWSAVKNVTTKK